MIDLSPRAHRKALGASSSGRLALLVALLLPACATTRTVRDTMTPTLDLEPPAEWTSLAEIEAQPVESGARGSAVTSERWWQELGSPDLDRLVDAAVAHNPTLLLATANLDAALAQARIDGAALTPQLSAGVSGSRRKQNFIGLPIPGREGSVLSTTSSNFGLSLNVSWEADLWGRLRAREQASLSAAAAASADLEAARLSIVGQTVKAWLALVEAGEQLALTERTLESRRASEQRVLARYRRGLTPSLDVRLSRSQAEIVTAERIARRQTVDRLARQLEVLTGSYPRAALEVEPALPAAPSPLPSGVPAALLARRPDLRAAEARAVASSARLRAARRALYPSLSLTGATGTASGALGDLLDGDLSVWSLAAGLLQPIFQGGRLRAEVDLGQAGLDAAEASWLDAALRAFLEVETALVAERLLEERANALAEAARQSRAAEELAVDRYVRGLADYLGVLDSQRSAFAAESQLLSARRERLSARVDLILALGGPPTDDPVGSQPATASAQSSPASPTSRLDEAMRESP